MADKMVVIKFDQKKLARIAKKLADFPRVMPKVMSRAVNRTITTVRAKTTKVLASKINLKRRTIRAGLTLRKATYRTWAATLDISSFRPPLFDFGARQIKKGVSYKIDKTTGRKKLAGAFIATMPSGHKGVFLRSSGETRREIRPGFSSGEDYWTELPIEEKYGVSLGYAFEDSASIASQVTADAYKNLEHNIDAQVALILRRAS